MVFGKFLAFLIFDPADHFAKAIDFTWGIAFAKWPIFKLVSFLECLVFFRAVFCTEQLKSSCTMDFRMFLAFLIFDPADHFAKAIDFTLAIAFARSAI